MGDNTTTVEVDIVPNDHSDEFKEQGEKDQKAYQEGSENAKKNGETFVDNQGAGRQAKSGAESLKEGLKDYLKDEDNQMKLVTKGVKQAETAISSSLKKGFGIVEEIYAKLKSASPLLQTIESLFNLAMTLFFMPLGNKLAEVLIPATVDLLDKVVDIWDAFEGKSLGEMFSIAISQGVKLFGEYFNNIGGILQEQGGMVSSIGTLLQTVGDFITNHGANLLNLILTVTTTILANFKHFVSAWVAMKVAEMALSAMGNIEKATIGKVVGYSAIASLLAFGGAELALTGYGMAEGGYVPAKAGGSLRVLGEGGKGEYVIPEDKMGSVGGTVTINMYGWTNDDAKREVEEAVNRMVSQSRIRGSF